MSNYCACSGGDEEYTIELNQQGPEGPQGPVGPEGFSPSISVKTSTDKAYVLTVVNKEGNFDTPNLYGDTEKLNADLSNIPNPAYINGVTLYHSTENLSSIELNGSSIITDVDGNLILNATASNEGTMEVFNYEVVANPKEQRLELHDNEGNVKVVATTDYIPTINIATVNTVGVVKPDGSTITVSNDGTISANLSNYVTNDELAVDLQDINSKIASKLDTATYETDKTTYATKEELASTNATVTNLQTSVASNTTSIGTLREDLTNLETTVGNNSADIAALDTGKLASSNIIAGANITIDRSGNNLTINSIGGGGGGSSIDDSSISSASTWSSSKINSEITTVANTKNDNIFDIGKFTVVGSPTITDEGVASGFSKTNYVSQSISTNRTIDTTNAQSMRMTYEFKLIKDLATTGQIFLLNYATNGINGVPNIQLYANSLLASQFNAQLNLKTGSSYKVEFDLVADGISYYRAYEDGVLKLEKSKENYTDWKQNNPIFFYGYFSGENYNAMEIYLPSISITIDGEVVFDGLMESTKPIYDKIATTNSTLSTFQTDTGNNFSAVNSALNEKANLSDLAGYVTVNKYNELLARVVALETEINGGNA